MFQRQIQRRVSLLFDFYDFLRLSIYCRRNTGRTGNDPHYPRGNTVNDSLYPSRE